jgi:hypothetical protein
MTHWLTKRHRHAALFLCFKPELNQSLPLRTQSQPLTFHRKGSPWHSLTDTQQVHPWMLEHPVHGMDGRLANYHSSPFEIPYYLLALKI